MRTLYPLLLLALAACGPAEVELQVNIAISPAWNSTIVSVDLMDIGGDSTGRNCVSVLAEDVTSCDVYAGFIPPGVSCALETWTLSRDPGAAGRVLHLSAGDHTLAAEGMDAGASLVAADCTTVTVVEGKTTDISFQL